jgi:WD40 repeat protein
VTLAAPARAMDIQGDLLAVGLKNGSIEVLNTQNSYLSKNLITSHNDGEVWGCICVDEDDMKAKYTVTSADDNRIIAYDTLEKKALDVGTVMVATGKKKSTKKSRKDHAYKLGASSMSRQPHECQSRCLAYLHNAGGGQHHLAVANNMGQITVRSVDWDAVAAGKEESMNNVVRELFKSSMLKDQAWIECMQYSPCGKFLAVGNHQQRIFVF